MALKHCCSCREEIRFSWRGVSCLVAVGSLGLCSALLCTVRQSQCRKLHVFWKSWTIEGTRLMTMRFDFFSLERGLCPDRETQVFRSDRKSVIVLDLLTASLVRVADNFTEGRLLTRKAFAGFL